MKRKSTIKLNYFISILAALLMFSIFPIAASGEEVIDIGSGSEAGTYYPFAVGIAQVLNENLKDVKVNAHSTGGSLENNKRMDAKELEMAMMQNDVAFYGYEGLEGVKINRNLRAIGTLYPEDIHIVVRKDSGIESLKDMIGKKIAIGNIGSGQRRNSVQILETAGILAYITKDNSKFKVAVEKLKNGEINGLFYTVGWPATGLVDLTNEVDCRFISLDKSLIQNMVSDFPFYVESFIPKGTYRNLNTDIKTIAVKASLVVREDLSDSLVYAITKVIFENLDFLKTTHKKWENVGIMKSRLGIGIPFHHGAEEYFEKQVVAVRKKPYSMARTIGYVDRGMKLKIYTDKWKMSKITTITGEKGWIPESQITDKKEGKIQGYRVKTQHLNFRKAPSLKNTPIRILEKDDILERIGQQKVLEDEINWIRVRLEDGEEGWVSSSRSYIQEFDYTGYTGVVKPSDEQQESPLHYRALKWLKTE